MATLYGTTSNDTVIGSTLNDSLYGYAGDDFLDGGAGFDTAYYSDASAGISVNLLTGAVTGGSGVDTLANIEAIYGSSYNDTLIGNNSDNTLNGGNGGQDYLSGGDGNDTLSINSYNAYACFLSGGNGNDSLSGGKGNDELHGNAGFDTLNGGKGGNDTACYYSAVGGINANLNIGMVTGGDDTDTLIDVENISGSWFGDQIIGDSLNNTLYGNNGDDWLTGNAGSDTLDGGSGSDTAIYLTTPASITANLLTGLVSGDGTDTLINIENIHGSAYNDSIIGNSSNNLLYGHNGNDYLNGDDGNDWVDGDSGNDSLSGGKGLDSLSGGAGDDTLDGGYNGDTASFFNAPAGINASLLTGLATGDGTDILINIENIQGSAYNDTLVGNASDNYLYGNNGNDYLSGDNGSDWLYGGDGNDTLDGGSDTDTADYSNAPAGITANLLTGVVIGEGTDTLINIENIIASNYDDTITGSSGNDSLDGSYGNDSLYGGNGNDTLSGGWGNGNDTLDGGDGDDTYYVNSLTTLVIETNATASGGIDTVYFSTPSYTLPANVENAYLNYGKGGTGLIGNALNNEIHASYYADTIDGGAGIDTVSYAGANSSSTLGVTIDLALSTAQVTGGSGTDTLLNIENLIGSDYADNLSGNASDNVIDGGLGSDTMAGATGNDTYFVDSTGDVVTEQLNAGIDLINSSLSTYTLGANIENGRVLDSGANLNGNALANVLYAGKGNNVLDGLAGNDTVSYFYATAAVTVSLTSTAAQVTGGSGSDTLLNIENLTGSAFDDALSGSAAANIIDGGTGNDSMAGAGGNDTYYVRQAGDVVTELSGQGTDTVISYLANYTLGANVENGQIQAAGAANMTCNALPNLIVAGNGNNVIKGGLGLDTVSYAGSKTAVNVSLAIATAQATGGSGSDTLTSIENLVGSNFADKLLGNDGANTLTGGLGQDTLTGNAGSDTFVFNGTKDSGVLPATADVITDFSTGDQINLSGIDANVATNANEAFTTLLAAGGTFTQAGQLKFAAGVLYGNTDADSAAEFVISLTGVTSLTLADLIL